MIPELQSFSMVPGDTDTRSAFRILFICMGNVCRSPMAEAALRIRIPRDLTGKIIVQSAGVRAVSGLAPTVEAELAARLKGYDLSRFRSQSASEIFLEQADIVLTMESNITDRLRQNIPHLAERIHTLSRFGQGSSDQVADPFGQSIEVYQDTLEQIDRHLDRIAPMLWKMARRKIGTGS